MSAFYNEIDPYAAAWLRKLIEAGHIAPGIVDERSIEDICPDELTGYTQCHFFAGIGVWSYALRRAGWDDTRPVWTGSCPCQPFSSAGAGAGFADERHLWPAFQHLIRECKPPVVLGEQVASKDADPWLDLVQTDLEGLAYAFGAVAFPSAGVGAPHIRDRTYWCAISGNRRNVVPAGTVQGMDYTDHARLEEFGSGYQTPVGRFGTFRPTSETSELSRMAHGDQHGCGSGARAELHNIKHHAEPCGSAGGMADDQLQQRSYGKPRISYVDDTQRRVEGATALARFRDDLRPGPTNGYWSDADWLGCRDGKWRPVEPGTFPLAHGAPARVGRLRAYGNAINAEQARIFIESVMEAT